MDDSKLSKPWPLDFSKLHRGSYITVGEIEKIYKIDSKLAAYQLKLLQLREEIMRYFEQDLMDVVCVRQHKLGLLVLTHEQQNDYAPNKQRSGIAAFMKGVKYDLAVDPSQLTEGAVEKRRNRIVYNSWLAQQMRRRKAPQIE